MADFEVTELMDLVWEGLRAEGLAPVDERARLLDSWMMAKLRRALDPAEDYLAGELEDKDAELEDRTDEQRAAEQKVEEVLVEISELEEDRDCWRAISVRGGRQLVYAKRRQQRAERRLRLMRHPPAWRLRQWCTVANLLRVAS